MSQGFLGVLRPNGVQNLVLVTISPLQVHKNQHGVAAYLWALAMVLVVAETAAAAAAEPESTDSMEHCRYESAEAWRRGERSRALQSDDHSI